MEEKDQILRDFADKFISNQEDLPAKFQKVIDDHFWELLEEEIPNGSQ